MFIYQIVTGLSKAVSQHTLTHYVLISLGYRPYTGDEIAIITAAPLPVTKSTQNHKGYDVSWLAGY